MRAVIQRVSEASVDAKGSDRKSQIARGWMVLCGVMAGDTSADASWLADKICGLRAFEDEQGKMNLSVQDVRGEILAVSQFTLCADTRKGRRPGFSEAARPDAARALFDAFVTCLASSGVRVATGFFQTDMNVNICNDGPVTFVLDSAAKGENA